jgi:beta-lactamase regulating signal transducer with metallopeptidase domain
METISRAASTFLLNALWQTAVVSLAAVVGSRIMRRATAQQQHLLWVFALWLGVLLPLWSLRTTTPPRIVDVQPAITPVERPIPFSETREIPIGATVSTVLMAGYLLFLLYRFGRLAWIYQVMRTIRASAYARPIPEPMKSIAVECARALAVGNVPIVCSARIAGPLATGVRDPVIVLPEQVFAENSPAILTAVLGHEMAHIRRRDFAFNLVYELIHLPLCIHPAAAFVKRKIDESRELACDDLVTARLLDGRAYARSLVSMANSISVMSRPGYSLGIFDADILQQRVARLLHNSCAGSRLRRLLFAAGCVTLAASATLSSMFTIAGVRPVAGTISGTIFDPSGARVPGATVLLHNRETGLECKALSNDPGEYSFPRLPDGHYQLEVRAPGFQIYSVEARPATQVNVMMRLGSIRETITVRAKYPKL